MLLKLNLQRFDDYNEDIPNVTGSKFIKIKFKNFISPDVFSIDINFLSNGVSYTQMSANGKIQLRYNSTIAFNGDEWNNTAYQIIEIDPTQPNFQAFITAMKNNIEGVELEAGTYQWIGTPENPNDCNTNLNFISNNENFTGIKIYEGAVYLLAYINNGTSINIFNYDDWEWKQGEAYRTITTTENQYVDYDFYNYAILGNQLVKQSVTPSGTHKLTFDSNITITANGSSVTTSPYNLNNGDVITATTGGGYKISINGTLYGGTSTININNQDINIVRSTAETFDVLLVTINYTETSTPRVSIDLTNLSSWGNVADGQHSIQVVAKADNYRDSEKSTAVSFTKGSSFTQVPVTRTSANRSQISVNKDKIYSVQTKKMPFGSSQEGITYFKYENGWTSVFGTAIQIGITSSTDTSIIFTGYSGNTASDTNFNGWGDVIVLEGNKEAIESDFNGFTSENNASSWSCIIEDTLITLANGETKKVQDITYDDELLVWNFYEGKLDVAKPCWIKVEETASKYNLCKFSNGVEIGFVGQGGDIGYHRIYNDELKSFTHTGVKETPIGTHTFAQDGSKPTLIEQHIVNKQVRYYNVGTEKHINIFTNGILTSSRISNKYAIKDMKYIGNRLISEQEEKEYINKKLERC